MVGGAVSWPFPRLCDPSRPPGHWITLAGWRRDAASCPPFLTPNACRNQQKWPRTVRFLRSCATTARGWSRREAPRFPGSRELNETLNSLPVSFARVLTLLSRFLAGRLRRRRRAPRCFPVHRRPPPPPGCDGRHGPEGDSRNVRAPHAWRQPQPTRGVEYRFKTLFASPPLAWACCVVGEALLASTARRATP